MQGRVNPADVSLMFGVIRAAKGDVRLLSRRWCSGNWNMQWVDGMRVFEQNVRPFQRFGEQYYPDDDSRAYYYALDKDNNSLADEGTENVPFKPSEVTGWRLVKGGFRWKDNGPLWSRHHRADGVPFYTCNDEVKWAPVPPAPSDKGVPPPPSQHGNKKHGWNTRNDHAVRTTRGPQQGSRGQSGPALRNQDHAAPTTGQSHPSAPKEKERGDSRWSKLLQQYQPAKGPLQPARKKEVSLLRERKYYGVTSCQINEQETVPIGAYVYFIHDFKVLVDRMSKHPGREELTPQIVQRLSAHLFSRMQVVRWSRKAGTEYPALVLLESARHVDDERRAKQIGRAPEQKPRETYSVWVPSTVIVTPGGYHAPAHRDMKCMHCHFVGNDSASYNRHLLLRHNEKVRKCPKCHVVIPFAMMHEHDTVCEAEGWLPTNTKSSIGATNMIAEKSESDVKPKTEEAKAEESTTKESKTEDSKTGEAKTEAPKTEEAKAEDSKAEEAKTGESKTEEAKAEEPSVGEEKSAKGNGDDKKTKKTKK